MISICPRKTKLRRLEVGGRNAMEKGRVAAPSLA